MKVLSMTDMYRPWKWWNVKEGEKPEMDSLLYMKGRKKWWIKKNKTIKSLEEETKHFHDSLIVSRV